MGLDGAASARREPEQLGLSFDAVEVLKIDPLRDWLPPWVYAEHGPSPRALRVRVVGESGVRSIVDGAELDAIVCPERPETDVWVLASNDYAYRLNAGQWRPLVQRQARGLDDL